MSCAKRKVIAAVFSPSGMVYVGENECAAPQARCPRLPGDGYEKCASVCRQKGHAEVQAIRRAGASTKGGTLVLYGHDHLCEECQSVAARAGIIKTVVL